MLVHYFGGRLHCYHDSGFTAADLPETLEPLAQTGDGCIEAFRHRHLPVLGILWHPEREAGYRQEYIRFLGTYFTEVIT